jgi:AdoMet-dependent heme synthase
MTIADNQTSKYIPSLISWNLTKKCNLKCPHCYMDAGRKDEKELSTEECFSLIDELKLLGTEMLILTGGEPLLRRDIYDISSYASQQGIWVVMGTNGVLLTEKVARKMLECGVKGVGISIDSLDPEKHNSFRGGPNAWEYSVKAMDICKREGLEILMQTTVMEMNYDEIPQMIDFARQKGAWSFNLYFLVHTGRGKKLNDLSPARTHEMLGQLVQVQDNYRPMLVRSKCAPQFKQIAFEKGLAGLESGGCMAGTQYARITPAGQVTPCPYMDVVAGDLRENSFSDIWLNSKVFKELRDTSLLKGKCGICEMKELCGGCRCRSYAAYDDYLQEDPACLYQPDGSKEVLKLDQVIWSSEAQARLDKIPIEFIRNKVKSGIEAYALRKDVRYITYSLMQEGLTGDNRKSMFDKMPSFIKKKKIIN